MSNASNQPGGSFPQPHVFSHEVILKIVLTALLTAIVMVMQLMGAAIHFGVFSVALVLIPIVIGAAFCGALSGAWLGFVFGGAVLISGDAAAFLAISVPGTVLTVLVKGIACGLFAGLVYRALEKKNRYLAVVAAAIVCPIVNTGVFLIGTKLFFMDTVAAWAADAGKGTGEFILYGFIGGNFLFEMLFNIVLSPLVVRLLDIGGKYIKK